MREVKYNQYIPELLEQLPKGVFLTVKDGEQVNTMTIGWGTVGYIWQRPIFIVAVRYSRHTYNLLEKAREFTVSIPLKQDLSKALAFCGSKSGRAVDKFTECQLTRQKGQVLQTPVIGACDLFYECQVVYQQAMEPAALDPGIKQSSYAKGDYHVLYYGEIKSCYVQE